MNEELQVVEAEFMPQKQDALALSRTPDVVLEEAQKAAKALAKVIESKPKKVQFNGKTYLVYEDWQLLARFYGVTAVGRKTKYVEFGEVRGFEATAEALLVSTNQVVSSAEALCLNDEPNWADKPLFQLKSMAQTRACAKALRNVLAWVVVLAGYAPTPAEEMAGVEAGNGSNEPSCPSCGKKGAIIKGKEEYGGGYLCYKKKGGCGAKFKDLPKQILEGQPLDQDYGDDPWQDDVPRAVNRSNINKAQAKLFWDTVKATGKTKEMVMEYFGGIGIEKTEEMPAKDFPAAYAWAGRPA